MYSRSKEGSIDAIGYEAEMLRFCREQILAQCASPDPRARSLYIEGFLLHFRNLVRFFSGKRPRPYDLSTADPVTWAARPLTDEEILLFQLAAQCLDEAYYQAISKYLQHCTTLAQKTEQEWNIDGMYEEIAPLAREFERRFLSHPAETATSEHPNSSTTKNPTPRLAIVAHKDQG